MLRAGLICAVVLACSASSAHPVTPDGDLIEKYDDVIRALGGLYGIDTRGAWSRQQVEVCSAFKSFVFAKYTANRSSRIPAFLVIYSPETKRVPNKPWLDGIVLIPYSSARRELRPPAERDATITEFNRLWLRELSDRATVKTAGMTWGDVGGCFARFSGLDLPPQPKGFKEGALDLKDPPTSVLINLLDPKESTLYIEFGPRGTVQSAKVGGGT